MHDSNKDNFRGISKLAISNFNLNFSLRFFFFSCCSLSSCRGPNGIAIAHSSSSAANFSQELIFCAKTHSIGSTFGLSIRIGHKIICISATTFSWAGCSISWAAADISSRIFGLVEAHHIIWCTFFGMTTIIHVVIFF